MQPFNASVWGGPRGDLDAKLLSRVSVLLGPGSTPFQSQVCRRLKHGGLNWRLFFFFLDRLALDFCVHQIFSHFPARTQSYGPTPLPGGLGNVVWLCVQEERERGLCLNMPCSSCKSYSELGWVELRAEVP